MTVHVNSYDLCRIATSNARTALQLHQSAVSSNETKEVLTEAIITLFRARDVMQVQRDILHAEWAEVIGNVAFYIGVAKDLDLDVRYIGYGTPPQGQFNQAYEQ